MIACVQHAIHVEHLEHVGIEAGVETLEVGERELARFTATGHGQRDGLADDFMGIAERTPHAHQVVGEVGRRDVTLRGCRAQALAALGERRDEIGECARTGLQGIERL